MNESLEEIYFNWLCAKVTEPYDTTYYPLLLVLHRKPFVWTILGDRNRAADGCELRTDFLRETGFSKDQEWFDYPCSVLEALIGIARRANFQTDIPVMDWFWRLIENLGLSEYRRVSRRDEEAIQNVLDAFVWRNYDPNGRGGLFPLMSTTNDQRKVEIWYQFAEYVQEQHLV